MSRWWKIMCQLINKKKMITKICYYSFQKYKKLYDVFVCVVVHTIKALKKRWFRATCNHNVNYTKKQFRRNVWVNNCLPSFKFISFVFTLIKKFRFHANSSAYFGDCWL